MTNVLLNTSAHAHSTNVVRHQAALELLDTLGAGSVGAIITDPPFFISVGRTREQGLGQDPWVVNVSTTDDMVAWYLPLAERAYRLLRPGGACVMMGGAHSISAWQVAADRAGLAWMAEMTVLWNRGKPRMRNFGSLTTTIRWHIKPGLRHVFNSGGRHAIYSNVLVCDKVPINERAHPAQKPTELTNFLISLLTRDDDLIVDPFCGSGSTLVSAAMCGRPWVGCDIDRQHCMMAALRTQRLDLESLGDIYYWINGRLVPVEEGDDAAG